MYFKDSLLYWKKNISKFFFTFLAIVIGMTAIIVSALLARSQKISELEAVLISDGNYDFIFYDVGEDAKEKITAIESVGQTGEIMTLGTAYAGQTEFLLGALDGKEAEEMLYLPPLEGRYPKETGEIAIDRITMLEMGLKPETGQTITVSIGEENSRMDQKYRVVGIIEEQSISEAGTWYNRRQYTDRFLDGDESMAVVDAPLAYIYCEEAGQFPTKGKSILMVNLRTDGVYGRMDFFEEYNKLEEQDQSLKCDQNRSSKASYARNILGHKTSVFGGIIEIPEDYQEAVSQIGGESTEKDVYSRVLIPLFSVLVAIATLFSLFEAVSSVFVTRERELGVYRCMGMSRGQVACKVMVEFLAAVVPAVLTGCLSGTLVYEGILLVANRGFGMRIPQAYHLDPYYAPFIKAATVPPYASAAALTVLAVVIVVGIFLTKSFQLSPLASSNQRRHALNKDRLNQILLGVNVVFLIAVMTLAFLYFKGQTKISISADLEAVETMFYDHSDYIMDRKENDCTNLDNEYRHDAGVSGENYKKLQENKNVASVHGIIECYGTKLVYSDGMEVDEEALEDYCFDTEKVEFYSAQPGKYELFHEAWNYQKTDRIYEAATVGAEEADVKEFGNCLVSGEIHMDAINAGQEVLLAVDEGIDLPFKVGDILPMDMIVYPKEVDESETYWNGGIIEGMEDMEPTYQTEEYGALYCFGERKVWQVKVGGIICLDEEKAAFFKADQQVFNKDWNIVTTVQGMSAWEIPAVNYTKVVVRLTEDADADDFEKLWFPVLNEGKLMETKSVSGLNANIATVKQKNRTVFYALAFMMIFASMVGILNAVRMRVLFHKKRNAVMRALGQETSGSIWNLLKGQALMVLCGCAFTEILVYILGRLSRIVYDVMIAWGNSGESPEEDWWGFSFPFYGNLWEWENYLPAAVTGLAVFAVAGTVTYFTYKSAAGKESIAEAMREE